MFPRIGEKGQPDIQDETFPKSTDLLNYLQNRT